MRVAADKPGAGVVATHIQNDGLARIHQQRYKTAHLRGCVGALPLEMDGDACPGQQCFCIPGTHQGFGLVKVEEMDLTPLCRQFQCQMHRQL